MEWNIADLVERIVDLAPDREALVCGDQRRTYAQLEERSNRLANHLASVGIGPRDHVGIYAFNSVEFVESMLGAYKLRAVPINVNYRYVEDELRYLFDNADLKALIHHRRFTPRIEAVKDEMPLLRHRIAIDDDSGEDFRRGGAVAYAEALASASPARSFGPRSPDDLYVLYTGGSTGMPKGVMWRHHDVIFTLGGGIDHATGIPAQAPEDLSKKMGAAALVSLATAPLMHGASQWATLGALFTGNKIVLYGERSFDADAVWRIVEKERVQTMAITGDAMARPLVEALSAGSAGRDLSSFVVIASTAAVFSPSVKQQFKERFPNLIVVDSVGASETGFHGTSMYQSGDAARGQAGVVRVRPGRDTLVLGDDGKPLAPGSGAVGKLARTGNVPLGYYKDAKKTAETFVTYQGRRYAIPGDFAKVEADGSIVLLGRGSVCINSGGEKVFPEEVEAALKSHPEVFDVVVVGVRDERWGERVAAVLQPRAGHTPTLEALAVHCRDRIASYKLPRALYLVERIERSPSGKPDYPWAKALAAERAARESSQPS
jgi:acyl-CoA synthetase (AMP-forming)/AMP-acid ligase II